MPREVNHGGHASLEEAVGAGGDAQTPSPAVPSASRLRRGVTARWFAAIGSHGAPRVEAPPSGPRKRVVAAPLAIGALVVLAAALAALDHVGMTGGIVPPLLLLLAALGVVLWKMGGAQGSPQPPLVADRSLVSESPSRGLELDGERLAFRSFAARLDSAETLLRLDAPFGVTLLASPRRDRLLVLFSSASGTFYLGAGFDAAARRAFAPLLDRCVHRGRRRRRHGRGRARRRAPRPRARGAGLPARRPRRAEPDLPRALRAHRRPRRLAHARRPPPLHRRPHRRSRTRRWSGSPSSSRRRSAR